MHSRSVLQTVVIVRGVSDVEGDSNLGSRDLFVKGRSEIFFDAETIYFRCDIGTVVA
jgi:hypothetical protein